MNDLLKQAYDPERFGVQGHQVIDILQNYLENVARKDQVYNQVEPEEEYQFWKEIWNKSSGTTYPELIRILLERSIHLHHPHYIGHQVSPAAPLAALGGLLSDFMNNGMGIYEMGGPASVIESIIVEWVSEKVGYGAQRGGFLTSGGSLANLTALLVARTAKRPDDNKPLGILVSAESHYSVDRSVRILDMVPIPVPVNSKLQIDPARIEFVHQEAENRGIRVIGMVGNACTTATGTYDDLHQLADYCSSRDLWFHVDGAHGAAVIFAPKYRHLIDGLERADSVSMDFHKMLMIPALCTALVFKRPLDSYRTYIQDAQYLFENGGEEWFNVAKRSIECTKYMMGVKVFLLRQQFGDALFTDFVTRLYDRGHDFVQLIDNFPELELGHEPESNIVCFRFNAADNPDIDLDLLNQNIRKAITHEGNFYIVQTKIRGVQYLRCTIMNPFTSKEDLKVLLTDVVEKGYQIISHTRITSNEL